MLISRRTRVPHPSGQARIRLDGKQLYLGKHQSPESLARYDALREDWLRRKSSTGPR